ncbi:4-hydroxy-tetrahydrodipicolinate reductase [Glycomyces sp. TRM65418]|uniref:4-hydroxy-tetrahydrodipicolinate reductase n=1 Tax=Glycomyces sp. TRM65418 TaxID=2867006 RepID=UPI001CE6A7E4|nr:4-hydroxy-tetrahydrodipicolinate reductase [Glycomyces sp. TRM65418]MCC3762283.1 4-hydroxy-tetrahydrodipicolinate reductase [Glycomyces sp. TRM65418]QZD56339.1 4-hydroxy-tetrahydrodipicolinate reductase [Glycomyces sp. TRM65418]
MIKVGVLGARGRMGRAVCEAVDAAEDLELVATVGRDEPLDKLEGVDVAVDFTLPDVVMENLAWCVDRGIHTVVGVSGFDAKRLETAREIIAADPEVGSVIAPNFGIGAVLMMQFAAKAAKHFDSAEIIEAHHPRKVDAPSGTAVHTARLIAAARAEADLPGMPDATEADPQGARGAEVEGVRIHAIRSAGYVASQEVRFGGPGERFAISHDSLDRASFMPGVILAVREVVKRPGLTVGIDDLLD